MTVGVYTVKTTDQQYFAIDVKAVVLTSINLSFNSKGKPNKVYHSTLELTGLATTVRLADVISGLDQESELKGS
jgi:hypothetical protein